MGFSVADCSLLIALDDARFVIHNNTCYRSWIMATSEKTISFRADAGKIDTLDSLAAAKDRPRSYLINEAITNYIDLHAYQDALVQKGLEEMRKGRVVSHEEVVNRLQKTGRASRSSSGRSLSSRSSSSRLSNKRSSR